jgi:hypothetical protein
MRTLRAAAPAFCTAANSPVSTHDVTRERTDELGSSHGNPIPCRKGIMSQRELGRRIFLNYVNAYEPRVLEQLHEEVFPLYLKEGSSSYREALGLWCSRWNLCDPWILTVAVHTLRWWWWMNENPESPYHKAGDEDLYWQFGSPHDPVPPSDMPPRRGRRRRGTEHPSRHYAWLAVWQVGHLTPAGRVLHPTQQKLAGRLGRHPRTVADALRKTAQRIGLTRRSEKLLSRPRKPAIQRSHKRPKRRSSH